MYKEKMDKKVIEIQNIINDIKEHQSKLPDVEKNILNRHINIYDYIITKPNTDDKIRELDNLKTKLESFLNQISVREHFSEGGHRKTRRHRHKKSSPKRKSIHRRKTRGRRHRKTRQRK